VFALDRAGIVGADGPTHAGLYDIAYVRCIPNCSMLTPSDENECRQALTTAFRQDHPVAVRYPRGRGVGVDIETGLSEWPWGKGVLRRESGLRAEAAGGEGRQPRRLAILAFGTVLHPALQAAERLDASVADMRFAKPLDADLVLQLAASHDALVTVEEGCVMGGAGSAVLECLAAAGRAVPVLQLGIPDLFTEHGDPAKILSMCGLDAAGIEQSILKRFGSRPTLAAVNG
jgi:1-deoxy-D-xylulose-5-phosphate synthase